MEKTACIVMVCLGVAASTFGNLITFDLLGDSAIYLLLDDQVSGNVTNGGLVAMFSTADGEMNRTGSGFGINAFASGDDTDGLNTGEFIEIVFDQAVTFSSLNISSWGKDFDAGEVQLWTTNTFTSAQSISGTGDTAFSITVNTNQTIRILATADSGVANGFSIDSFTVAIPEPAVVTFIALITHMSSVWY